MTLTKGSGQSTGNLKTGALGWPHVAVLSVAGCGPASVVALNLQFMGQFAGAGLVLAFVLVWPGVLLLVGTFAEFSRRIQSSGGLYTWNAAAWGNKVGFVYGWTFAGAYLVLSAAGFTILGGWISDWIDAEFDLHVPWLVIAAIALCYVTLLALRGIEQFVKAALALLAAELAVIIALAITIFVRGPRDGSGFGFEPFSLSGTSGGFAAVGLAMTYAILAHVGIEEGATLGEEAADAHKSISRGLIIAALVLPTFYIVASYAVVYGYGIDNIASFARDVAPVQAVADRYWGSIGRSVVVLAVGTSILAFSQTVFVAGSRVLYSLGRAGVLPRKLSGVSNRSVPYLAIWLTAVATALLGFPLGIAQGPANVWGYYGFLISIAFMVSYIVTNAGLVVYTRRLGEFRPIRHGVLGVLGSLIFLYPLYRTVWPVQSGAYGVLPYVYLGWIAIGFALMLRKKGQEIVMDIG